MNDETVVETEGITVTKSFDAEGFPVPAVTFQVESDRSDPVEFRIVDEIPEGFGIEQIGFHPDYGSEHWTATGEGGVRFERTVNAGESFTTVYGIRMADDEDPKPFLEAPEIEVDPDAIEKEDIEDVVPGESSEVVRELASGERDSIPGLEEEETAPADAEAETTPQTGAETLADDDAEILSEGERAGEADLGDEEPVEPEPEEGEGEPAEELAEKEGETAEAAAESEEAEGVTKPEADTVEEGEAVEADEAVKADAPAGEPEPVDADTQATETQAEAADQAAAAGGSTIDAESITSALAAEIREGNVDDEDLDEIRQAVIDDWSPSDQVRVEHLQSRVSDLEAYTDALESFIDENGDAQELLEELESEVESFESDLEELEDEFDEAARERQSLDDRFDNISEDLTDLSAEVSELADVSEQVDRLESDLEALDERVDDAEIVRFEVESLEEDVESLREDVEEVKEWRDQLSNVFGGGS